MDDEMRDHYRTRIRHLRDAVELGLNDVDQSKVQAFEAEEAADYLIERASELTGDHRK